MTLNSVLRRIRLNSLSHNQVRSFTFGRPTDFLTGKKMEFPAVFIQDNGGTINIQRKETTLSFRFFVLDLVNVSDGAKENEQDVLSDTLQIAQDLIAVFNFTEYVDWKVEFANTFEFVVEQFDDLVGGVVVEMSITIPYTQDICAAPGEFDFTIDSDNMRTQVQTFTESGTWTKPAGAKIVMVQLIGGGAGGSNGGRSAVGITLTGGGGGAAGGYSEGMFRAADLPESLAVTVGSGGAGTPGQTVDGSNPVSGQPGEDTSFGAYLIAKGGTAPVQSSGGSNTTNAGATGSGNKSAGGNGGAGGNGTTVAVSPVWTSIFGVTLFSYASSGGGGGGGITNGNPGTAQDGALGGAKATLIPGPLTQATNGVTSGDRNGGNGSSNGLFGTGGGGGASNSTGAGGNGGHGGNYGAGGGGGGSTRNGNLSGAGGNGAPGIAIVTTIF